MPRRATSVPIRRTLFASRAAPPSRAGTQPSPCAVGPDVPQIRKGSVRDNDRQAVDDRSGLILVQHAVYCEARRPCGESSRPVVVAGDHGLSELLLAQRAPSLARCHAEIVETPHRSSASSPAARARAKAAELLASTRMTDLVLKLQSGYDFIPIDSPDLATTSDIPSSPAPTPSSSSSAGERPDHPRRPPPTRALGRPHRRHRHQPMRHKDERSHRRTVAHALMR